MKHSLSNRGAFTLIELLVVIGIIGALAALLFPVLVEARRSGRGSVCTSNLRQLGHGIAMYAADWDGGMPFAPDVASKAITGNSTVSTDPILRLTALIPYDMRELLKPYGCDLQMYRCPLDWGSLNLLDDGTFKATDFEEFGSSYWYDDRHALSGFKLGNYPTPSTNVIMSDYLFYHRGRGHGIDLYSGGTTNLLFADIHVKSYAWKDRTEFLGQVP